MKICWFRALTSVWGKGRPGSIPELLDFVGWQGRRGCISTPVRGMKRRLTLARHWSTDPDILFPRRMTTGLDPRPAIDLGAPETAQRRGRKDADPHHPFHGRGRAALRPADHRRPGPRHRRGSPRS